MTARSRLVAGGLIVLALVLGAYANHWQNGLHFDDAHTVSDNAFIRRLGNIPLFFRDNLTFSTIPTHASYRPLVSTTLAIDYALGGGLKMPFFHLSTFLFFLGLGALLYVLASRVYSAAVEDSQPGRDSRLAAIFAAGVYLLHPACAETVNYVIARSDAISTFFVVAALVVQIVSPRTRTLQLPLALMFIGCLAKPTALMYAPIVVVHHALFVEEQPLYAIHRLRLGRLLVVAVPAFVVAAATFKFLRWMEHGHFDPGGSSLFHYVITQPWGYLYYASQFFLPIHLSADTDMEACQSLGDPRCLIGFAFLALLVAAIFATSARRITRPIAFGLSWFLIALVPTTFVPLAEVVNDHRMFFPFVGLTIAMVWAARLLLDRFASTLSDTARLAAAANVLIALTAGTHARNRVWHDEESLWRDVTIKSPRNARGQMNYGLVFLQRGEIEKARNYFEAGLKEAPNYSYLHTNLGIALDAQGDAHGAEIHFRRAQALSPDTTELLFYARFLDRHGRRAEAISLLQSALALNEGLLESRHMLLRTLLADGRLDELRKVAARTLEIAPGDPVATEVLAQAQSGKVVVSPSSPQALSAEGWLAVSLTRYQNRDYAGSIDAARAALALRPQLPEAWNNICAAHNASGNYVAAVAACQEALRLAPNFELAKNNLAWAHKNGG